MDFELSERCQMIQEQLERFMAEHIYPNEAVAQRQIQESGDPHHFPEILEELKSRAKALGLWNLFLPDEEYGAGLTNAEYAPLCEIMGRSEIASTVFNCAAPDTGNMEILAEFGTPEQKQRWLRPLLEGEIRSCFSMTEPEVSGADPTGLRCRATRDGDAYVIEGHKWYTSGAEGAAFAIVMAVTDPHAAPHARASMIIVPTDTPGFDLIRSVPVMGETRGGGHGEIRYENCRVPASHLLGPEHGGFSIAQARLGPGRIHHCMRWIGICNRAFDLMCARAVSRTIAPDRTLADKDVIQTWIAECAADIQAARLMVLNTAWKIEKLGWKEAREDVSMIKFVTANTMQKVIDHALQVHGGLGMTDDTMLAFFYRHERAARIYDGADEVHKLSLAKRILRQYR